MIPARRLLAIASGIVLSFGFAPLEWWGAAILGVAAFTLVIRGSRSLRGSYLDSFLFGLGFFLPLLTWVRPPGTDAWIALAIYQAAIFAIQGPLTFVLLRSRWWPVLAATAWVTQEAIRSRVLFGGFPWGRLAFSQADAPTLHWAQVAGAPGVSLVTALAGTLLAGALVWIGRFLLAAPGDLTSRRSALVRTAGLVLVSGLALVAGHTVPLMKVGQDRLTIAMVQGNVPRLGLNAFEQRAAVLRNHVNETIALADAVRLGTQPRPDIVIWPENSSDIDPLITEEAFTAIERAVHAIRAPILVGAVLNGRTDSNGNLVTVRNAGIVFNVDGSTSQPYVKRHPVPFGEYIPFRSFFGTFIGRLSLIPYDFEKGRLPGDLRIGPITIGDVICFEVAYDGIVRDAVNGGGEVIVVQTNNATFGRSSETRQQLAMSRVRAVEHHRTTLVSATSGISAIIEPSGRVLRESQIFTPDLLVASIPVLTSRTVADRVGATPEWVVVGLCLLLIVGLIRQVVTGRKVA